MGMSSVLARALVAGALVASGLMACVGDPVPAIVVIPDASTASASDGAVPPETTGAEVDGGAGADATFTTDALASDGGQPTSRVVFLSSKVLGGVQPTGVAAFDAHCQSLAGAVSALSGKKFKAWLSTTDEAAVDHVGARGYLGEYRSMANKRIAANGAALVSGNLDAKMNVTETGIAIDTTVWTGTKPNGTVIAGGTCGNWKTQTTGAIGSSDQVDGRWTDDTTTTPCGTTGPVYCFEAPP